MTRPTLKVKAADLGFAHINATARDIDWSESYDPDGDGWEMVTPRPTLDDIAERAPDLLSKAQAKAAKTHPDRFAPDALTQAFKDDEDAFEEWRQGFEPMMSFVWPVMVKDYDGATPEGVADLLAIHARAVTLIHFGDNSPHCPEPYGFALSGGGMDLSDHLVAAYLVAGHVPPLDLLLSVRRNLSAARAAELRLIGVYKRAKEFLNMRVTDLAREIAAYPKPEA